MLQLRRLLPLLASVVTLFAVPLVAPAGTGQYPRSPAVATFVVDGQVAHPRTLTVEDLRQFAEQRVRARFGSGDGREEHRYRGALLLDVLQAAQPQFDSETKNDALRHAVLVTASDGYQAALAWGEIDPRFAATEVLLAYEEDRQPLARPRLVVPSDERGGRYVTDVTRVSLLRLAS